MKQLLLAEIFPTKLSKSKQYNPREAKVATVHVMSVFSLRTGRTVESTHFFLVYPRANLTEHCASVNKSLSVLEILFTRQANVRGHTQSPGGYSSHRYWKQRIQTMLDYILNDTKCLDTFLQSIESSLYDLPNICLKGQPFPSERLERCCTRQITGFLPQKWMWKWAK